MATRAIAMSDSVTAKLKELAARAHGTVQVGFIDSDQAPIAFWNEFGHKGRFPAPARPFFRTMVANESPKWLEMMAGELKRSKMDGHRTLAFMGDHIEGDLKKSIINFSGEPLSDVSLILRSLYWSNPQDIRARDVLAAQELLKEGYGVGVLLPGKHLSRSKKAAPMITFTQAKPLIWKGDMLNSTTYKVTD